MISPSACTTVTLWPSMRTINLLRKGDAPRSMRHSFSTRRTVCSREPSQTSHFRRLRRLQYSGRFARAWRTRVSTCSYSWISNGVRNPSEPIAKGITGGITRTFSTREAMCSRVPSPPTQIMKSMLSILVSGSKGSKSDLYSVRYASSSTNTRSPCCFSQRPISRTLSVMYWSFHFFTSSTVSGPGSLQISLASRSSFTIWCGMFLSCFTTLKSWLSPNTNSSKLITPLLFRSKRSKYFAQIWASTVPMSWKFVAKSAWVRLPLAPARWEKCWYRRLSWWRSNSLICSSSEIIKVGTVVSAELPEPPPSGATDPSSSSSPAPAEGGGASLEAAGVPPGGAAVEAEGGVVVDVE
eukprot:RCo025299